jgi:hypothetical protein
MKRLLSIILVTLLMVQLSSASAVVEYSVELNSEFKWKLDYSRSEGTDSSFKETIINGTISANITQTSDQGVYANLTTFQYVDGNTSYVYGLVKLLEGNISNLMISVAGNITDIFFGYDEIIPFIWPTNDAYWNMIIPNFNRSITPEYEGHFESSNIMISDGYYAIDQFKDATPVDGGRNNASIRISSLTGLMEEIIISTSYFYTINPPVITQMSITLVDMDYVLPERTQNNLLNYLGISFTFILISIIAIVVRSKKNFRK